MTIPEFLADAKARLIAASTGAGNRIDVERGNPYDQSEVFPRLWLGCEYTERPRGRGLRRQATVQVTLQIDAVAKTSGIGVTADADLTSSLHGLIEEVKDALFQDSSWLEQFDAVGDFRVSRIRDHEGNALRGALSATLALEWGVLYTPTPTAATTLDDLEEIRADITDPSGEPTLAHIRAEGLS